MSLIKKKTYKSNLMNQLLSMMNFSMTMKNFERVFKVNFQALTKKESNDGENYSPPQKNQTIHL